MKKKTLMITGASGFVGRNFIEKYKDDYNIIPVSLRDRKVEELDYTGVDTILHLAALVHQMKDTPEEKYFQINTELTKKLAEKAKENKIKHFVFYSTVKVYGYDGDLYNHDFVLTENSLCEPNDPYGKSKYEAEKILKKLENENFKVAIIRPPMIYGPGVKGNMLSLIKLVDKLPILPFNYKENKRTIIGIENLLHLTNLVITKDASGIYLGTEGEPVSIYEIIKTIENGLNKKRINIRLPDCIFKILCKLKPNIIVRLYGSLAFKQENKYKQINYKIQKSMDNQIDDMMKNKVKNKW